MVVTVSDSPRPPTTVSTVAQRLVCDGYAVFAVILSCATLASLRSAPIVLHCLYCCLFVYCPIINECIVREYMLYRRNWLTYYIYIVYSNYHSRRKVVRYRVVEENGQGAVEAPPRQTRSSAGTPRGSAPLEPPAGTGSCGITVPAAAGNKCA